MKKKILVIALVDGRTIERDISFVSKDAPLGAKANDAFYAGICRTIACAGYEDTPSVTEANYTYIGPSQIKSVSVNFRDNE